MCLTRSCRPEVNQYTCYLCCGRHHHACAANSTTIFSQGGYDKFKDTYAYTARCAKFNFGLGSVYMEPFVDKQGDQDQGRPTRVSSYTAVLLQTVGDVLQNRAREERRVL